MTLSLTLESSVEKSIAAYLMETTLDTGDKYNCEKCKTKSRATVRGELCKLPNVFVFHLKRFEYFPVVKKLKNECRYKSMLTLSK